MTKATATFTPATMIKLVKAHNNAEIRNHAARNARYVVMFSEGIRHTDMVKSTTRLADDEWESLTHSIKISQRGEVGRIAKLSKEAYKLEKAELSEAEGKAFAKLRSTGAQAVGSIMRDMGASLLRLDTPEEQARIADTKKDTAKKDVAKDGAEKTGRDKIIDQLVNIEKIMRGDEDPNYSIPKLQEALMEVALILGMK